MDKLELWVIELHFFERKKEMEEYLESCGHRVQWLNYNHIMGCEVDL